MKKFPSFSSNLKTELFFKYDDDQHRLDIYHYTYLCFARKVILFSTEVKGYHGGKWLYNRMIVTFFT